MKALITLLLFLFANSVSVSSSTKDHISPKASKPSEEEVIFNQSSSDSTSLSSSTEDGASSTFPISYFTEDENQSCTSIIVGAKASTDGSVITSHTCDGKYRTWISMEPSRMHKKGSNRAVYKNTMYGLDKSDSTLVELAGYIPQTTRTYAYLNTAYPCMNEEGIGIGETTWTGPKELQNPKAMFLIEELARLALERCSTARQAVRMMGELAQKYGYADVGECLTVADKKEVWFFEIIGCGKDEIGAVWVAKRLPDDHVGVSANVPRIGLIERSDERNFMCSDNVEAVALKHGLWDGKSEFKFWKVYKSTYANGRNYRERDWYILNAVAPSLGLSLDMDEIPFSVKPDSLVDVTKVFDLLRANYEGTPLDPLTKLQIKNGELSPIANPWLTSTMRNTLNHICPDIVPFQRTVSVAWCSYSTVIQIGGSVPKSIGAVCFLALDNPGQSPRIPIFARSDKVPSAYDRCGHNQYDPSIALWQFRKANKLATLAWQKTKKDFMATVYEQQDYLMKEIEEFYEKYSSAFSEVPSAEDLNAFSEKIHLQAVKEWEEMEYKYWIMFGAGF